MVAVSGSVIFAGLELGLYNFIGTSMEAVGLQITSATRAGFITQSCAVITPALAYLGVRPACPLMRGACLTFGGTHVGVKLGLSA